MNMDENYITLELHKILESLAEECTSQAAKRMAGDISPITDADIVRLEVGKTFSAYNATAKIGSPSFFCIF